MPERHITDDLVYFGIKGTVLALEGGAGQEVWRTPLKGAYFTNVTRDGNRLFAATRGEVFCLDARTGEILWHNPLKGMGYGLITIGTASQSSAAAQNQFDEDAHRAAANAST
jgi:outer membrane protein assembly factor BamB